MPADQRMKGRACPPCRVDRCDRCSQPAVCGCTNARHAGPSPDWTGPAVTNANRMVAVAFEGALHADPHLVADGVIYGEPVPGAYDGIVNLVSAGFEVVVTTCQENVEAVAEWMLRRLGLMLPVTNFKPPALVLVDPRAVPFTDWLSAGADIRKRVAEAAAVPAVPAEQLRAWLAADQAELDQAGESAASAEYLRGRIAALTELLEGR